MSAVRNAIAVLDEALLGAIAARGGLRRYPANAVLINEGDEADSLYIILSGRVKVYAASESGKQVILSQHGPGEYLGELALDGGARSASVMTLEPSTFAVVTRASLQEFIAVHPEFAQHLILNLIQRVRRLTVRVKSLALDDVYSRIVAVLYSLSVPDGERRVVPDKLTQQDIAEHVGASREMVSRVFKELSVGGYVEVKAGRIVVLKKPPAAW